MPAGITQAIAGWRRLTECIRRALENLPNRQMGEHAHGQDDPQHYPMRQETSPLVVESGLDQGLLHDLRRDNLAQAIQPIQNLARRGHRLDTASLPPHSHSLPETLVLDKHKVSDGCDLRFNERYCG